MNSLSPNLTSAGQQLDKRLGISPTLTPFTNAIFDSTTYEGVHFLRLHLYKVLSLPLPPPKISQFNPLRFCLHTGLRHGPQAPNGHLKPVILRGSQHHPWAPNLSTKFQLMEYLDISDNDSALVCNVMVLVCFELMMTLDTVLFFCLASGLFDYLLVFPIPFGCAIWNCGGVLVYSRRYPKVPRHTSWLLLLLSSMTMSGVLQYVSWL
jgi:hypothetical protein